MPVTMPSTTKESLFRTRIETTLRWIEKEFEDVDPDVAEAEYQLGALTLTLTDRSRCILSSQPSVEQLWLALASHGIAHHFNFDPNRRSWFDDKGQGIELFSYLRDFFRDNVHIDVLATTPENLQ